MSHPQTKVETGLAAFERMVYGYEGVVEWADQAIASLQAGGAHDLADRIARWVESQSDPPAITEDEKEAAIQTARRAA